MSKSKNFRPEEKKIHRVAKEGKNNTTKYKHLIYNVDPDTEDELEEVDAEEEFE